MHLQKKPLLSQLAGSKKAKFCSPLPSNFPTSYFSRTDCEKKIRIQKRIIFSDEVYKKINQRRMFQRRKGIQRFCLGTEPRIGSSADRHPRGPRRYPAPGPLRERVADASELRAKTRRRPRDGDGGIFRSCPKGSKPHCYDSMIKVVTGTCFWDFCEMILTAVFLPLFAHFDQIFFLF